MVVLRAVIRSQERAKRVNNSQFMKDVRAEIEKHGVIVLSDAWFAGGMAAKLFSAQTWVSCVCGLLLLMISSRKSAEVPVPIEYLAIIFVVSGMLLALLVEFAVAPRIVARDNLKLWHGVGSAMYVMQWVCAGATLWRLSGPAITSGRQTS